MAPAQRQLEQIALRSSCSFRHCRERITAVRARPGLLQDGVELLRQFVVTNAPLAVHDPARETVKIDLRTFGDGANHSSYDVGVHRVLARPSSRDLLRTDHPRASFNFEFSAPAAFGGFFWSSTKIHPPSVRIERIAWPRCLKAVTSRETVGMETPSFLASFGVECPPCRIRRSVESSRFSMSNER